MLCMTGGYVLQCACAVVHINWPEWIAGNRLKPGYRSKQMRSRPCTVCITDLAGLHHAMMAPQASRTVCTENICRLQWCVTRTCVIGFRLRVAVHKP